MSARQRIFLAVVVLSNTALWAVPSDVVALVARDRHTLLGRYSREHFGLNLGVLIASVIGLYIDRAAPTQYKRRWFQVIATLLFLVPSVALLDFASRVSHPQRYIRESPAYHRPANVSFTDEFVDRPEAFRTYPDAPQGHGRVRCEYHTDGNGFRNSSDHSTCDVVVLGDSFAEGSKVSDEHAWPVRLADATGLTVCNLGMSGYGPAQYLASLEEYGLARSPSVVLCMLYEGNDFRGGGAASGSGERGVTNRIKRYVKQSPVLGGIDRLLVGVFGPVCSKRDVPGIDILDWLPIAIPEGPSARHYAFAPKQLLDSLKTADLFRESPGWRLAAQKIVSMKAACDEAGANLVIVYAPSKAHVVMPLVGDRLPADKVRAFAALRAKDLPPGEEFLDTLMASLPARETAVREWCESEGVPFVSVTGALRARVAAGDQVYYTYDQHWTPGGHEVVAAAVRRVVGRHIAIVQAD